MNPKFTGEYSSSGNWWLDFWSFNDSTRRYSVNCGDFCGGKSKSFWFFRNAWEFALDQRAMFVDIHDEKNKRSIRLRGQVHDGVKYVEKIYHKREN